MRHEDGPMSIQDAEFVKRKNLWITVPVGGLVMLFVAGLMAPEWVADAFRLNTKAEAAEHERKITDQVQEIKESQQELAVKFDAHVIEFRSANASAMLSALRSQRDAHEDSPEDSPRWRAKRARLNEQVRLAEEYSNCLLDTGHNCHLLQRQLMATMIAGG